LPDGSWVLPYTGYANPHKYPHGGGSYGIGLASWPKGRLAALTADDVGEFTTVPIIPRGGKLRVNALVDRNGSLLIEAARLDGSPIAGRSFADGVPIIGDQFWTPVTWKAADDLGIRPGEPVVLRFRMKLAKVYGIEFK
jgi:hypothetical protein